MSTLSDRLKSAMADADHMSQAELARRCGVKQPSVHGWLNGKSKFLRGENLLKAAAVLNVSDNWLASGKGPRSRISDAVSLADTPIPQSSIQTFKVKVQGTAMVDVDGFWAELEESKNDDFIEAATSDPQAYAIRIAGRRYYPVIDAGQCILISPAAPLRMNKRVLVSLDDGRHTMRIYLNHQDGLWMFTSLTDANDILQLRDADVTAVERVTSVLDFE